MKLPAYGAGGHCVVFNDGANAVDIFPATNQYINALAINTAYSLAAGASIEFWGLIATGAQQGWKTK